MTILTPLAVAALAAALMAAGCAQMPFGSTGQDSRARPPATQPEALPAPEPAPPPDRPPPPKLSPQLIQRAVAAAVEYLEAGDEGPAVIELERVLVSEPGHRLAQSLMRQIKEDPQALLGRESFAYRVQPGESLSRIAQRFLNDVFMFYALARYNDIKVPRLVAGGQTIRVPGKAPPPGALAAPAPTAAAPATKPPAAAAPPAAATASTTTGPTAPAAAAPAPTQAAVTPASAPAVAPPDPGRAQREREAAIAKHSREARSAFAKQDLDGAIRSWDAVLAIDPNNTTAQLERQKAVALKERLRRAQQ